MQEFFSNFHFTSTMWAFAMPFIFIGFDLISGLVYAWSSKTFKSSKMRSGLTKKCGEIIIIILGEILSYAIGLPKYIMNGVIVYICVMEGMSILENLDKMNVPIPSRIKRVINNPAEQERTAEEILKMLTKEELKQLKEYTEERRKENDVQ